MANKKRLTNELDFRPAKPSDARVAGGLIFDTFPRKAIFLLGLGCEGRARKILSDIFPLPGHRLSYEFTTIVKHNNQIVAAMVHFPGSDIGKLDRRLYLSMLKQYKLPDTLKLIRRALPLIFIKETNRDEYFLSNLVVRRQFRGQGIGGKMLSYAEERAKNAGFSKISLIVNLENKKARRFYDRHGYKVKALNLVSNRHVPHLGPGSERRVKKFG